MTENTSEIWSFENRIERTRKEGFPKWADAMSEVQLLVKNAQKACPEWDLLNTRAAALREAIKNSKWGDARAELTLFNGHFAALKPKNKDDVSYEDVLDTVERARRQINEAEKELRATGREVTPWRTTPGRRVSTPRTDK